MYMRNILITALAATSTTYGINFREEAHNVAEMFKRTIGSLLSWANDTLGGSKQASCPAVWNNISSTLTEQFLADGQCTDAARAAIRASFHDCFNGACDGSLILANECSNTENRGLERICGSLANIATQTKVGVADLIQFAAAHAIKTCPGGPTVPVKIGRIDSSTANALGVLPGGNVPGDDLVQLFGKSTSPCVITS
jgi:hypothetical protein